MAGHPSSELANNKENRLGQATALRNAAKNGKLTQVRGLFNRSIIDRSIIDTPDDEGYTALSWAATNGHADVVAYLVKNGADVNSNAQKMPGNTALLLAVAHSKRGTGALSEGHFKIVKQLLEAGAKVNARVEGGPTALLQAARDGQYEIVENLFTAADIDIGIKDHEGHTALSTACGRGFYEIAEILLRRGRARARGDSIAIVRAAQQGSLDIVKLLLENMEEVDVNVRDERGRTAISYAAQSGSVDIVQPLLQRNADMNIQDNEGHTAVGRLKVMSQSPNTMRSHHIGRFSKVAKHQGSLRACG
ncbi:unnamed protein product [Parascedosporium putredinis]|uniref:Ankyrin n=1 Tax=Parascedosporium putredinis TaxID=1442378 RepID=A0A9P1H0W2_9PEZI|nr:unnamed protein product [Parascedosporium putredinis]CAI7993178.1 unnamed protein product [Parascedosporium putredinis]